MKRDVVDLWTLYLNDGNARDNDRRRERIKEYAGYLVDSVLYYQNNQVNGHYLPKKRSTHLIVATNVVFESAIYSDVISKKGAVGLMQVMPRTPAINGYRSKKVQNDPKLGIDLGVRWLTHCMSECANVDADNWNDDYWKEVISVYVAGSKAKKGKKCKVLKVAKLRYNKMMKYKKRIILNRILDND